MSFMNSNGLDELARRLGRLGAARDARLSGEIWRAISRRCCRRSSPSSIGEPQGIRRAGGAAGAYPGGARCDGARLKETRGEAHLTVVVLAPAQGNAISARLCQHHLQPRSRRARRAPGPGRSAPRVGLARFHAGRTCPKPWCARAESGCARRLLTSGFEFPAGRITVNLSPADLPKEGGRFDLPIAVGILAASGQLARASLQGREFYGELALAGELRETPKLLPALIAGARAGREFVLPAANASRRAGSPARR